MKSDRLLLTGQTVSWIKQRLSDHNKGAKCCEEVMVALDKTTHKPTPVPGLILETKEEREEWDAGRLRQLRRKG